MYCPPRECEEMREWKGFAPIPSPYSSWPRRQETPSLTDTPDLHYEAEKKRKIPAKNKKKWK